MRHLYTYVCIYARLNDVLAKEKILFSGAQVFKGSIYTSISINSYMFYVPHDRAFAVVTCPPINKTTGEMYNNKTCTSETKKYSETCEVSCTLGYNLTRIDCVHKCTENGTWSNDVTCERT